MLSCVQGSVVQNIGIMGTVGIMVLGILPQTHVFDLSLLISFSFLIVYSCLKNNIRIQLTEAIFKGMFVSSDPGPTCETE